MRVFTIPIFVLTLIAFSGGVSAQSVKPKVEIYTKFEDFEKYLHLDGDTTYVVNFWATWCKPCVDELPYFDSLALAMKDQKVRVILVTIDFEESLNKRVIPFINKRNVLSQVVLFDDPRQNDWIPKISKEWSGAIPATYIYRGKKTAFYEQQFSYKTLYKAVEPFLTK